MNDTAKTIILVNGPKVQRITLRYPAGLPAIYAHYRKRFYKPVIATLANGVATVVID